MKSSAIWKTPPFPWSLSKGRAGSAKRGLATEAATGPLVSHRSPNTTGGGMPAFDSQLSTVNYEGILAFDSQLSTVNCTPHARLGNRGDRMSGLGGWVRLRTFAFRLVVALFIVAIALFTVAGPARAQQPREREPNSVYAERRAKLLSQVDGPIILSGYTGREEKSQTYIFAQEDNFYYLTGPTHDGAALLLAPERANHGANAKVWDTPRASLFL